MKAAYFEHTTSTRERRSLPQWKKVLGVIIPFYGVYNTQTELDALSTVLEQHMNSSDTVMGAIATEVTEIREVVLQNRMVLDIMLAERGGVCKIVKRTVTARDRKNNLYSR